MAPGGPPRRARLNLPAATVPLPALLSVTLLLLLVKSPQGAGPPPGNRARLHPLNAPVIKDHRELPVFVVRNMDT